MTRLILCLTILFTSTLAHEDHSHGYMDPHQLAASGHHNYYPYVNAVAQAPVIVPQVQAHAAIPHNHSHAAAVTAPVPEPAPEPAPAAFPTIVHEHDAVAFPEVDVFPPVPRKVQVMPQPKPVVFMKPPKKRRTLYRDPALPYMPGFKWNNYTNQREE